MVAATLLQSWHCVNASTPAKDGGFFPGGRMDEVDGVDFLDAMDLSG